MGSFGTDTGVSISNGSSRTTGFPTVRARRCGTFGARDVLPLYRDSHGARPNVPAGLFEALSSKLGVEVNLEHLAAYVYGLTGTAAFAERFVDELGEGA